MTTQETIYLRVKNNYGNEHYYPECKTSRLIAELTGKKTLTKDNIHVLKAHGYKLEPVSDPITI
jgi:hypothetical protein